MRNRRIVHPVKDVPKRRHNNQLGREDADRLCPHSDSARHLDSRTDSHALTGSPLSGLQVCLPILMKTMGIPHSRIDPRRAVAALAAGSRWEPPSRRTEAMNP